MLILPAIDLIGGKAVRLYRGDYARMTVYNDDPVAVARDFEAAGAVWVHMVDLDGAKSGGTPNLETVRRVVRSTSLRVELGGGVRTMETIEQYLDVGVSRVILGTAAVTEPGFAGNAARRFGEAVAAGVDLKDGRVAIRGWTETAEAVENALDFCREMQSAGVSTLICTDISKDGAMEGANAALYRQLSEQLEMNIIASGGVSSIGDVKTLRALGLYGAIIGKAYYTGAIDLKEAIEEAK